MEDEACASHFLETGADESLLFSQDSQQEVAPLKRPRGPDSVDTSDVDEKRIRLASSVVVVEETSPSCSGAGPNVLGAPKLVRISSLQHVGRRSTPGGACVTVDDEDPTAGAVGHHAPIQEVVIQSLLRPGTWDAATSTPLAEGQWMELCDAVERVLSTERTCLQLRAPIKVFGDLHGQFGDLMRLFEAFGAPTRTAPGGDLALCDYLFLGDYVDRGAHSLETVALLFALKVAHPRNVFLLRGNHESSQVNHVMGFFEECCERLGRGPGEAVWARVNRCFDWLPVAAVIDGRALCLHGGLGQSLRTVADIDAVRRPLSVPDGGAILTDILWSDPTDDDSIEGVHPNTKRGPGTFAFGPDRVRSFCEENGLDLVIRGHECVMDGFERFAQGQLVTVFSATNYCGVVGNSGCCMLIDRDLQCLPQIIVPNLPPAPPSPPTPLWPHGSEALDYQEPGAPLFIDDGTAESRMEGLCVASASGADAAARHEEQLRAAFSAALEAQKEEAADDGGVDGEVEFDGGCGGEEEGWEAGHGGVVMEGAARLAPPQGLRSPRRDRTARSLRFEAQGKWRRGTFEALPPTPAEAAAAAAAPAGDAGAAAAEAQQPVILSATATSGIDVDNGGVEAAAGAPEAAAAAAAAAAVIASSAAAAANMAAPPPAASAQARLEGSGTPAHMAAGHTEEERLSTASSAAAVAVA